MEKIRCKCIDKSEDKNNNIIRYILQDEQSRCMTVQTEELKRAISSKQLDVINLKLTSDGILVECNEVENLNDTIARKKTETDLSYEKQLQEFAEYINRGRKTNSRIMYTKETTERINTLYNLGVKPGTINGLYQNHLFYCGKTAIVIDNQHIVRTLLDWTSQEEYNSTVLSAIIDWLNSDNNLEGLNLLELTTSIRELIEKSYGEWSCEVTYQYNANSEIYGKQYTPSIFATTTLSDDTGVALRIPIRYDAYKKKYVLDINLSYIDAQYRVEHTELNDFEIDTNKEGFKEFSIKLTELLTTDDKMKL